jgi:excinuclease ABC subunit A
MDSVISLRNARLHNLKNVSLDIPKNKLVVFTGLSGSGKSTLVFDIINKEGQRQILWVSLLISLPNRR